MTTPPMITDFSAALHSLHAQRSRPALPLISQSALCAHACVLEPDERTCVQSTLTIINQLLDVIVSGIHHSELLSQFLREKHQELEEERAQYEALVAPIRRLPPELLQQIFITIPVSKSSPDRNPPIVAQVSRHWRNLALATPELWTEIFIPLSPWRTFEDYLEHVQSLIKRAGAYPLTLSVRTTPSSSGTHFPPLAPRAAHSLIAASASSRLRYLHIGGDAYEANTFIETLTRTSFCDLTNLRTVQAGEDLSSGSGSDISNLFSVLFRNTRFLEKVFLHGSVCPQLRQPLPHLRVFCGFSTASSLHSLLCNSPLLEVLELEECPQDSFLQSFSNSIPSDTSLALNYLSSIRLGVSQPSLLECLPRTLPSLRHFIIGWPRGSLFIDQSLISTVLQRYGLNLDYLGLSEPTPSFFLHNSLRHTPNLKALRTHRTNLASLITTFKGLQTLTHIELDFPPKQGPSHDPNGDIDSIRKVILQYKPPTLRSLTFLLEPPKTANASPAGHWQGVKPSYFVPTADVNIQLVSLDDNNMSYACRFDSPYFVQKGGIFDNLYTR